MSVITVVIGFIVIIIFRPGGRELRMLERRKLEVFVIVIIIIIATIMEVESGKEEEWVITMVGEQFYLYTIKVIMIIIMIMKITILMMIVIIF